VCVCVSVASVCAHSVCVCACNPYPVQLAVGLESWVEEVGVGVGGISIEARLGAKEGSGSRLRRLPTGQISATE